MRPEYEKDNTIHSIQTWEEACVRSQQWADGARLDALRRKRFLRVMTTIVILIWVGIAVLLFLFLTDNLIQGN